MKTNPKRKKIVLKFQANYQQYNKLRSLLESGELEKRLGVPVASLQASSISQTSTPTPIKVLQCLAGNISTAISNGLHELENRILPPLPPTPQLAYAGGYGERDDRSIEDEIKVLFDIIRNRTNDDNVKLAVNALGKLIGSKRKDVSQTRIEEAIALLTNLINSSNDDEMLIKASNSLNQISPSHPLVISTLTQLMNNAEDEVITIQRAEKLGTIDSGNQEAIAFLKKIIKNPEDDSNIPKAIESLDKISDEDKTDIARGFETDIGFKVGEHSLKLSIAFSKYIEDNHEWTIIIAKLYVEGYQGKLPEGIQLIVIEESGEVLNADNENDDYFSLPFSMETGEIFTIQVTLNNNSYSKVFQVF